MGFLLAGSAWSIDVGAAQTVALVIGVSQYRPYPETPTLPSLNYAQSDARKMTQALQDPEQGRVRSRGFCWKGRPPRPLFRPSCGI